MKQVRSWWLPDEEKHLADWIAKEDNYQTPHRKNALKHVTKWGCAVDIGAHVGLWSREFCEKFSEVHAFEPVSEHRGCYVKNVTGNFTLHPYALGDEAKNVAMVTNPESTGCAHVDPNGSGSIEMRTLDSFNLNPDFIKLDCEAYEIYVLKGAEQTLLRCKPVICMEQKDQRYYGNERYMASRYLESLGAKQVSRHIDDCVFAWP